MARADIKRLFLESLVWGFLFSFFFAVTMNGLGIFRYRYVGPFAVLGAPIWLNLAWSPSIMVYLYFQPEMRRTFRFALYLLSFSLLSALLDAVLNKIGLLVYCHWSPVARFTDYLTQALVSHQTLTGLVENKGWVNPYDSPENRLREAYREAREVLGARQQ